MFIRKIRQRWQSWPDWLKTAVAVTLLLSALYVGVYVVSMGIVLLDMFFRSGF